MGREIADEDVFFYNAGFTSKFYKVKVGTVSAQKETEPEKADTRHKARPAPRPPGAALPCLACCQRWARAGQSNAFAARLGLRAWPLTRGSAGGYCTHITSWVYVHHPLLCQCLMKRR